MLLFLQCDLWSIIGDSGFVVSSLVSSASAFFSFHLLTGKMGTRPPPDHYASITIRAPRSRAYPSRITLVDDVITRGSSFVGIAPRIQEAYPDATVQCFALVRTISTGDVDVIFAPTVGTITYRDGLLMRQP